MKNIFKNFKLEIEMVDPFATMPRRGTSEAAGLDVFAPTDFVIPPRGDAKISLGWKCQFPPGFALIAFNKSGRASNDKLSVGACVVDSDYRGEVHAQMFNNSNTDKPSGHYTFPGRGGWPLKSPNFADFPSLGFSGEVPAGAVA